MFFWAKDWPIESIESHTLNLIKNFNKLKVLYPGIKYLNWDLLELACIYHDMGKINTKFQNKLVNNIIKTKGIGKNKMKLWQDFNEEKEEIWHNYLSPAFLPYKKLSSIFGEDEVGILARAVFRHHRRKFQSYNEIDFIIENVKEDTPDDGTYDDYFVVPLK